MSAAAAVEAVWGLPQDMPKHEGQQACKQTGLSNSFSSKQKLIEVFKEAATVTLNAIVCKTVACLPLLMCVSTAPCCLPLKRAARRSRYALAVLFLHFFPILPSFSFRFRPPEAHSCSLSESFFCFGPPLRNSLCVLACWKRWKESERHDMSRFGVLLLGFGFRHELPIDPNFPSAVEREESEDSTRLWLAVGTWIWRPLLGSLYFVKSTKNH